MKKIINNITAFLLNGKQDDVKEEKQPNDKFKDWLLEFRIKESVALDKMLMNLSIAIIAFIINYILDKDFLNKLNNYCNYYIKISFLDINWFVLILIIFLSIRCCLVECKKIFFFMLIFMLIICLINMHYEWLNFNIPIDFITKKELILIFIVLSLFCFMVLIYIKLFFTLPKNIDALSINNTSDKKLQKQLIRSDILSNNLFYLGIGFIILFFILFIIL